MLTLGDVRNGLGEAVSDAFTRAGTPPYTVADVAPDTFEDVMRNYRETGRIIVWNGASENTIFPSASVNWQFRAWHDWLHIQTGIGFTPQDEILLGRIQAGTVADRLASVVLIEVAEQARYYAETGLFIADQIGYVLPRIRQAWR